MHSSVLDEKQALAALTSTEENVPFSKVAQATPLFEHPETGYGEILEQIDRGERGGFDETFGCLGAGVARIARVTLLRGNVSGAPLPAAGGCSLETSSVGV